MNIQIEAPNIQIWILSGFLVVGVSIGCEGADEYNLPSASEAETQSLEQDEMPFTHPMQDAVNEDGKIALWDVKNTPNGQRYVVGDGEFILSEHGHPQSMPSVFGVTRENISEDERQELAALKGPPPQHTISIVKVSPKLAEWRSKSDGTKKQIDIALRRPESYVPRSLRDEIAIATTGPRTREDYRAIRLAGIEIQQTMVQQATAPVKTALEAIGAKVVYECRNLFCISAELNASQLEQLGERQDVLRMDPLSPMGNDAITGTEVTDGHQMRQFVVDNYLGDPSWVPMQVGVMELSLLYNSHPGFLDSSSTSSSRVIQLRECDNFSGLLVCLNRSNWASSQAGNHATAVTGLVAGDLTDDQDPVAVSNPAWQDQYSGYGREAEIKFWGVVDTDNIVLGLDDIAGDPDIHILNQSISIEDGATPCSGTTVAERALNGVFDAGILVFKSAGNEGANQTFPDDCTVQEPGAAIGAFTVGVTTNAVGNIVNNGNETTVRTGNLANVSDVGGTPQEGQNRWIIDLVANGPRKWTFTRTGSYNSGQFFNTSASTPTVAGAALQFADWYNSNASSAINNPSILHAAMLLMGDRTIGIDSNGNDIKTPTNGHNRWGAGRMKMRRWDSVGLDGPSGWGMWSTCIDDGEVYYFNLNGGNPISSDVDALKAVIYWYDRRHENGVQIDDLDMRLEKNDGGVWTAVRSSATFASDWERIYWDDFSGNHEWRLRIYGWSVESDNELGCNTDSMRVRIAHFFEDSDRESWENLGAVEVE